MKKITEEKAKELLEKGIFVKCKISSRETVTVKDLVKLNSLLKLKAEGVQSCDIFLKEEEEVPKDAIEISLEEAIRLIVEGEIVYGKKEEQEEEEITTRSALMQYYRSALLYGKPLLYWYV